MTGRVPGVLWLPFVGEEDAYHETLCLGPENLWACHLVTRENYSRRWGSSRGLGGVEVSFTFSWTVRLFLFSQRLFGLTA